ncbi:hypothetical protein LINPERPRIM_LOCUS12905 [Linum perenne]
MQARFPHRLHRSVA